MRRKVGIIAFAMLAVLCLFTVFTSIFMRTNSFCRQGRRYFCPGYDFTLRMNEIECLRQGVNPFRVWNEDITLSPYISTVPKKPSYDPQFSEPVNAYTPWAYSMMLPLSFLPQNVQWGVYFAFMFVCVGIVAFCGYNVGLSVRGCFWDGVVAASAPLVLSFYPIWSNFSLGNFSVVILAALALMAFFLGKGRDVLAGLCLAVAMIKPQMSVLFVVPLLWRCKFLTCAVAACTCIVLSIPPALMCKTSPIDLISQAPAASVHAFQGCGTLPYFLCSGLNRGCAVSIGLCIGLLLCVLMTWTVRRRSNWFLFMMPAAVCSMAWTYSQMFTYALGWFLFLVITAELLAAPGEKPLWVVAGCAVFIVTRLCRIGQCLAMVVFGDGVSSVVPATVSYNVETVNSTVSIFVAAAICVLNRGDDHA